VLKNAIFTLKPHILLGEWHYKIYLNLHIDLDQINNSGAAYPEFRLFSLGHDWLYLLHGKCFGLRDQQFE
tara:strand:- start:2070 stop:2279 length:210 start_codon:yes stop_codon:yes gene_type:complete